jgi:hypothetical protein
MMGGIRQNIRVVFGWFQHIGFDGCIVVDHAIWQAGDTILLTVVGLEQQQLFFAIFLRK